MSVGVPWVWPLGHDWPVCFTADKDMCVNIPAVGKVELRLKYGSVWRELSYPPDGDYLVYIGQHVRISQREA